MGAHRDTALVIGVAGTDDRYREAFFPVFFHQKFLAGDLVAGILPVGIAECGALRDDIAGSRFMIRRCGTDVDILIGPAPEKTVIPFHIRHGKSNEFADGIKVHILQFFSCFLFVMDVRDDLVDTFGNDTFPVAPVEQPDLPVRFISQPLYDGRADGTGSSDEQCFHGAELLSAGTPAGSRHSDSVLDRMIIKVIVCSKSIGLYKFSHPEHGPFPAWAETGIPTGTAGCQTGFSELLSRSGRTASLFVSESSESFVSL